MARKKVVKVEVVGEQTGRYWQINILCITCFKQPTSVTLLSEVKYTNRSSWQFYLLFNNCFFYEIYVSWNVVPLTLNELTLCFSLYYEIFPLILCYLRVNVSSYTSYVQFAIKIRFKLPDLLASFNEVF